MFETSRDILNWAIAASVVAVAVMLVWAMAYMISMLRTLNDINRRVRGAVESFTMVMAHLQDKIQSTAGYLPLIVQAVTKLASYFMDKKRAAQPNPGVDDEEPPRQRSKRKM
jgi:hypothetical protein